MITGVKIELSGNAVKIIVAGAVVIGFLWWISKLAGDAPDDTLPIRHQFQYNTAVTLPEQEIEKKIQNG